MPTNKVIYRLFLIDSNGDATGVYVVAPPRTSHGLLVQTYRKAYPGDTRKLLSVDEYGSGRVAIL